MAVSLKRRRAIIAAHGGVCHYCGAPDAAQVDHIVPRAGGGSDDLGNLIAACPPCNMLKADRPLPAAAEQAALAAAEAVRDWVMVLERRPDPAAKRAFSFTLPDVTMAKLDVIRGSVPRAEFIRRAVVQEYRKRFAEPA